MKTVFQILSVLWHSFVGVNEDWNTWAIALFVIFRLTLSAYILPFIVISAMAGDSGTDEAIFTAYLLMFTVSLLFWSILLWSWRCLAAFGSCILSFFLFIPVMAKIKDHGGSSEIQLFLCRFLALFFFLMTECWAAPVRRTYSFLVWCMEEDENNSDIDECVKTRGNYCVIEINEFN